MHVPFDAGLGWIHLAHKNADLLLLVSIASLGLLPLVSIYIIETEKYEESALLASSEFLRSCLRGLVYLAIIFPYLLALLSTYVSIQLIRGQGLHETNAATDYTTFPYDSPKIRSHRAAMFWLFYKNTKVLKPEDKVVAIEKEGQASTAIATNTDNPTSWWKIPCPGLPETLSAFSSSSSSSPSFDSSPEDEKEDSIDLSMLKCRLVTEDCAICMHPYRTEERLVWSSNPNCIHCYHYSCLQAWMEPWDARTRRCPCCRQSFFIVQ